VHSFVDVSLKVPGLQSKLQDLSSKFLKSYAPDLVPHILHSVVEVHSRPVLGSPQCVPQGSQTSLIFLKYSTPQSVTQFPFFKNV
jgi:hypothetical protein